jgi:hypothetical protein
MLRHLGVVGVVGPLDLGGGHDRVAEVAMPKSLSPLAEKGDFLITRLAFRRCGPEDLQMLLRNVALVVLAA